MSNQESKLDHLKKYSKEELKNKDESFWRENLTPLQFEVMRNAATEAPRSGFFDQFNEDGEYYCSCCGEVLFRSNSKFDAGCGWPSFAEVAEQGKINYHDDDSLGRHRIEVTCASCDAHLGHVFDDGPLPGGTRYCINSVCLGFNKKD